MTFLPLILPWVLPADKAISSNKDRQLRDSRRRGKGLVTEDDLKVRERESA